MSTKPVRQRGYTNPQLLAETDWLAEHMDDPTVCIVIVKVFFLPAKSDSSKMCKKFKEEIYE